MTARCTHSARPRQRSKHGLPTAAVGRSSQATPARRRGQACGSDRPAKTIAFGAALPTPATGVAGVDNTHGFRLIVAG